MAPEISLMENVTFLDQCEFRLHKKNVGGRNAHEPTFEVVRKTKQGF